MLVLGSGLGRESLAIAQRGVTVVGVDTNDLAVRTAVQFAGTMGARAHFSIASFLELPFASDILTRDSSESVCFTAEHLPSMVNGIKR